MDTPTLSIVIVTKNEEKNIRECLESVKWADEIILIDHYSTDKTIEIAKDYTSKIYTCAGGPFKLVEYNKNYGMEKATKDWILNIDADERISSALKEEILYVIQLNKKAGYSMRLTTNFMGKPFKWRFFDNLPVMRLCKRGKGYFDLQRIHNPMKIKGDTEVLSNRLFHCVGDISDSVRKQNMHSSHDAGLIITNKKGGSLNRNIKNIGLYNLMIEPYLYGIYLFFFKKAYVDGIRGLIACFLLTNYVFLERAKVYELLQKEEKSTLE